MNTPYDPLTAPSPGTGEDHMPSYWTATAGAAPTDDGPAPAQTDTEIAIIGGGYTGLSCAYHLASTYGIKAVVLEANRPGWGCSGRNGGFARAAIGRRSHAEMIKLWGRETARHVFDEALAAVRNVRDMMRDGDIACDALEAGHLKVAHRPGRAPALAREAELLQREFNYPAQFLPAEMVRREHIGGTQSHGALRFPDAIAVHPLKLAWGVLKLARSTGATVHSASPVTGWNRRHGDHLLATPQGTVRTRKVVLATNGYTPERLHDCLRGTTLPVLSHIIVTRPMTAGEKTASGFATDHVLTDTRNLLYYWRRLPDDRILFGGRGLVTDSPAGRMRQRVLLLSELKAKLPALRDITVDYDWWGWVCLTADFLPHIHHAADDPTVHYAIGCQGSGVAYGLYAGKLLARRLAGEPIKNPIPSTTTPLPRFPLAALRRAGQRAMYRWYRFRDNAG
ncbi:MAG: FAD-binding oxidoreductase [Burkholderiales bacterium]|nr:FAD-binding oxidoreductase [Burkholderiales bacterium]